MQPTAGRGDGERLRPGLCLVGAELDELGDPVDAVLAVQVEDDDAAGAAADADVAAGWPGLPWVGAGAGLPAGWCGAGAGRAGLGPAKADRLDLPTVAPRALTGRAVIRWLRAANMVDCTRDRALALTPFYAGARIAEVVAVDLDDVQLSARKGTVRFYGKGGKPRTVDLHPELREAYQAWVDDRATWPGNGSTPALFLNRRGGRLGVRGASDIFAAILDQAGLDDDGSAHVLRHTMATTLVRGGADLVTVAEMLGHARLDQTRRYTLPTAEDRRKALELLPVDR